MNTTMRMRTGIPCRFFQGRIFFQDVFGKGHDGASKVALGAALDRRQQGPEEHDLGKHRHLVHDQRRQDQLRIFIDQVATILGSIRVAEYARKIGMKTKQK